uniref:NADH dehydrogenase subunit 2 n=1 Tax=Saccharomycopsis fibuligera TaxID=4944 RepID=UPI002A7F63FD|nr:NADH dehydrogenase subunit 2 [Saccharomycopsis fibuligera]WPA89459.1 NADH dehydrogenase subunit 2 [Saccharomycopsis fibuligera]
MLLISLTLLIVYVSLISKNIASGDRISDFTQEADNKLFFLYKNMNRMGVILVLYVLYLMVSIFSLENINSGISLYNNLFKMTSLSTTISMLITMLASIFLMLNSVNIMGYSPVDNVHFKHKEYVMLILFNLLGLMLFPMVNDIISLFVMMELQSYSLYLMTTTHRESNNSTKSGLMYFLLGGLASMLMLLGSSMLYFITGMTSLDSMYTLVDYDNYISSIYFGFVFIVLGLIWKMGLAPFHNWSITVYNYTPTIVTSYISLMAKFSMLPFVYTIIVNTYSMNSENNYLNLMIAISILLSMIIGSMGGLNQMKMKVTLAYSGVINAGYLLLALLVNSQEGMVGFIVYIYQYGLTHINLFFILLSTSYYMMYNANINNNSNNKGNSSMLLSTFSPMEYMNQLNGLLTKNSYLAMALMISLFSLMGMPPLMGFYGKFFMTISSTNKGYMTLSLALMLFSVVTTVYYAYIIKTVSFTKISNFITVVTSSEGNKLSNSVTYVISTITLITLVNICQIDTMLQGAYILAFSNLVM